MIAERLKELRTKAGVSQEKLGKIVNVSQQAVGKWEKAIAEPDSETLKKLASYFDVSVDYLLGNSDIPNPELRIPDEYKDLPIAFYEGAKGLSQEDIDDVVKFMEFLKKKKSDK